MNPHIDAQITNMLIIVGTFEQSCKMAAMKNDGKIDSNEAKAIKRITAAADKFKRELEKIKKEGGAGT